MELKKGNLSSVELKDLLGGITVQGVYKALKQNNIDSQLNNTGRRFVSSFGVRDLLESKGFSYPKLNISLQMVKGGVGKTSLSFSLAVRTNHYGARVLIIDMDQQGNLTRSFNVEARDKAVWLNLVRDNVPVEEAIVEISEGLHLIPSNLNNSRLDVELTQSASNLKDLLRDKIASVRDNYDLVIIDCPPAINKINTAVTCGSDLIIIPTNPDPYAMDGLDFAIAEIKRIKTEFKLKTLDYKVVWNRYDARERLGAHYMHALAQKTEHLEKILPVVIRVDASLKNAIFDSKSIFELPKKALIREDIDQFSREILGINEWQESYKKQSS